MADGASLEKVGVEPDEIVLPTPADLAAGRDPELAHAIELAGASVTAKKPAPVQVNFRGAHGDRRVVGRSA